jgi:transcriptional regulator GlxA family with amidase domain
MMQVSVLVPRGDAALSTVEGSFRLFTVANDFLAMRDIAPRFETHLVGIDAEPQVYQDFFSVKPDRTIDEVSRTDLVIIPAVNGDMSEVIAANAGFFPWIRRMREGGAELASLCVGAFLLAATGLLEGRKCATHWNSADEFRRMFPEVNLVSDSIITDEDGIYSSGGALSFWNLLLYLAEKHADRDMAIFASKFFEIDIDRDNQSSFLIFSGQKDHGDEAVRKAQDYIEANYRERLTLDSLCDRFMVGRRSLERRFKQATGNTISEYIQRVRIEAAKKCFETSRKNIAEVMYEVGYTDTKAFRAVFRKIAGMAPMDYRGRYQKEPVLA